MGLLKCLRSPSKKRKSWRKRRTRGKNLSSHRIQQSRGCTPFMMLRRNIRTRSRRDICSSNSPLRRNPTLLQASMRSWVRELIRTHQRRSSPAKTTRTQIYDSLILVLSKIKMNSLAHAAGLSTTTSTLIWRWLIPLGLDVRQIWHPLNQDLSAYQHQLIIGPTAAQQWKSMTNQLSKDLVSALLMYLIKGRSPSRSWQKIQSCQLQVLQWWTSETKQNKMKLNVTIHWIWEMLQMRYQVLLHPRATNLRIRMHLS